MDNPDYTATVREDFDRIASLPEVEGWDHNVHYHGFLLGQLPPRLDEALDVGCGTGAFARALAGRCGRVLALDLSPRKIEVARSRSGGRSNIEYAVADANAWPFPEGRFGCVASITTLHHLPLASTLRRKYALSDTESARGCRSSRQRIHADVPPLSDLATSTGQRA